MSDEQNKSQSDLQANPMPITIHTQYVRDISFENPNAPDALRANLGAPEMNVNIGMDARALKDDNIPNLYEVALRVSATAKRGESAVFLAEIVYSVVVSIDAIVPEDQHHPILLIEIPRHAFPYARQILSTLTSQGGYPPLLLNPVDFQALYVERFREEMEAAAREEQAGKTQ